MVLEPTFEEAGFASDTVFRLFDLSLVAQRAFAAQEPRSLGWYFLPVL
jgi:hypothetical protein